MRFERGKQIDTQINKQSDAQTDTQNDKQTNTENVETVSKGTAPACNKLGDAVRRVAIDDVDKDEEDDEDDVEEEEEATTKSVLSTCNFIHCENIEENDDGLG